ncbi:MAG: lipopolysaccharide kinase InaA family protein [Fidelibacterota bacterium]
MALNLGLASPTFSEFGILPGDLNLSHLLDRQWLETKARTIYDCNPNLVCEIATPEDNYIVKWFGWRSSFHYHISPLIRSRAQVSWEMADHILQAGGSTPQPIYTCTRREKGFIRENIFITAKVNGSQSLRDWLKSAPGDDALNHVLADLARNLAALHSHRIFHCDLTAGNILIDERGKTYLIDLNRGERKRCTTVRCLADLAKIYFGDPARDTTGQIIRLFFREYAGRMSEPIDWEARYRMARQELEQRRLRKKQIRRLLSHRK